jgi:glycosyltransferase involved in cell wall biosynthesis
MNIGLLTRGGIDNGSSRVRALQFVPRFEEAGHATRALRRDIRPEPLPRLAFLVRALRLARWADVLLVQKPNCSPKLTDLLLAANPALVVDVDDAVWSPPPGKSGPNAEAVSGRSAERLCYAVRRAGTAVAGSRFIARWLEQHCPEADVRVIPPSVDLERYSPAKRHRQADRPAAAVWVGSSGNLGDLDGVRAPLEALIRRGRLRLRVVCDGELRAGLPCEYVRWDLGSDVGDLLAADIGIMPLGADERSRGRCGYKALQCMALGIPVVASDVGAGHDVVDHGVTGFLASNHEEWSARLEELALSPELRARMGAAARVRVRERFSVERNHLALLEVLQAAARGARGGSR